MLVYGHISYTRNMADFHGNNKFTTFHHKLVSNVDRAAKILKIIKKKKMGDPNNYSSERKKALVK